ncbi:MAG: O-methyltransferase [Gorillibacterium sp.]|nr:O-methyltransferase [Gorillibacterium sp.]
MEGGTFVTDQLPLPKQMDYVFREIKDELRHLPSGTVFVQIRNNVIGKFGIKHNPLESRNGCMQLEAGLEAGLTEDHLKAFCKMAIDSLRYKVNWTHGEIFYEFAVRKSTFSASVQFESNYNLANVLLR